MKFIKYLEGINGIAVYPLASLLLFTSFFVLMLLYTFRTDKLKMDQIRQLPLDSDIPKNGQS
jgi:cbb3-type cytochrome oxidase subunit 3